MKHIKKLRVPIATLLILAIALSKPLTHLLTEWWWFQSLDQAQIFWTSLTWQTLLWITTFLLYTSFLWINYRIALHETRHQAWRWPAQPNLETLAEQSIQLLAIVSLLLLATLAAATTAPQWQTLLQALNAAPTGQIEPILGQDISFYLFQLPLYDALHRWFLGLGIAGFFISSLVYLLKGTIAPAQPNWSLQQIQGLAKLHLSTLISGLFALLAWGLWLSRYHLLNSKRGLIFGIGYTDHHARLPAALILSILAAIVAILWLVSLKRRTLSLPIRGTIGLALAWILLTQIYPTALQQLSVTPNELTREKDYLNHHIQFTQSAYHLEAVQQQPFQAHSQLTPATLQTNQLTLQNIRLWDYRPLLSTYRQLQEIRLYYTFRGVDVDRYRLNGNAQQVMLSAREFAYHKLPAEAQTWINRRFKYTHGYGIAMSPVNRITPNGLPEFYIKDIPPAIDPDLQDDLSIQQPRIYYGEQTDQYIFTGTSTDEFDYPIGNANASHRYQGSGGVPIPSFWHRLTYAYEFNNLQLLTSNYLTHTSRIHYDRQIKQRIHHLAPFLQLDADPYLALIDGRLQWILDAYTISDRYPYSQPLNQTQGLESILQDETLQPILDRNLNYIRNSVKIVIDAYDGKPTFWILDDRDPILATYRKIFPKLFTAVSAIAPSLQSHFRYPRDLFKVQTQVYSTYHMRDPEVFYNREDLWAFPLQIYEGNTVILQPYYVIMRLPGEAEAQFILIQPFTPSNKDNMIAWMAARSNGQDYGKLLLYEFPKQRLIYGPRQIEARIDQEPEISQQFTLWSQAGSKVIRGDLLVIPIDQSLLYVEPVYLRAEQGELPELKRVIVAYDQSVVMENSLDQAIATTFGNTPATPPTNPAPRQRPTPPATQSLASTALEAYRKSQEALRQGNWAEYGRQQQQLEQTLKRLNAP